MNEPILRVATTDDMSELEVLVEDSGIALSRGFYSDAQARAITDEVYGVDSQLLRDRTYFVIEDGGAIVASGGWSRRATLYGGDQTKGAEPDPLLDPHTDPARIRAFFVASSHARRGLGSQLMRHSAAAAWAAGFRELTLVATLPGVPLYEKFGFVREDRVDIVCAGVPLSLINMSRPLPRPEL
jgi:GNAT superfamily N-acetyltransferase